MDDWVLYNQGLPMINVCTFLQVDYCGGHIRAAGTRGVHQAPLFEPSSVLAGFMVDRTRLNLASPCVSQSIHASAVSVVRCEGATYEWTFEGGQVVDTNGPDAWVDYQEAGTFDVTLTVTDAEGASDTWTWSDLVEVVDEPVVPTEGFKKALKEANSLLSTGAWKPTDTPGSRHTTWLTWTMEWHNSPTTGSTRRAPTTFS